MTKAYELFDAYYDPKHTQHRYMAELMRNKAFSKNDNTISRWVRHAKAIRRISKDYTGHRYADDIHTVIEDMEMRSFRKITELLHANGFSVDEVCLWLDAVPEHTDFVRIGDEFVHASETTSCDNCSRLSYADDTSPVYVSRNETLEWCEDCRSDGAFFCEASNEYYSARTYTAGEDFTGNTVCVEWVQRNDWYCLSNGAWSPDPEEDEDDPARIPAYHESTRNWKTTLADRSLRPFYGFEIEVYFGDSDTRSGFYSAEVSTPSIDWTSELDGSLCDYCGLEIITRPIAYDELVQPDNLLRRICKTLAEYRVTGERLGYGVHITTNAQRFTRDHRSRFTQFIINTQRFSEYIARRTETDYYKYVVDDSKHSAVAPRPNGAYEVRIFQSTTDYDMLMSYTEYLEAVAEWTYYAVTCSGVSLAWSSFRRWVMSQPKKFPHLIARFTPKNKENLLCASQSSNPQMPASLLNGFVPALQRTQTVQDSLIAA